MLILGTGDPELIVCYYLLVEHLLLRQSLNHSFTEKGEAGTVANPSLLMNTVEDGACTLANPSPMVST